MMSSFILLSSLLKLLSILVFVPTLPSSAAVPTPDTTPVPLCKDVVIPVTISASNRAFSPTTTLHSALSLNIVSHIVNLLFSAPIHGTFDIAGRYCEPAADVPARRKTLQVLVHPATYDKNYWSPDFDNKRYSWTKFASQQGYPTLAIDRLGNGQSSHPDPIATVQIPAQAATVHELVTLARAGGGPFPRCFESFIFVGSSMGSIVGNVANALYPTDFNATILTGFSKFWANVLPGFTATAGLLPASLVDPGHHSTLPPGYLEASSQKGVEYLLFYGANTHYDPAFTRDDFAHRGTITVGEAASGGLGITIAGEYKGDVFVMTGAQDVVFCGTLALPVVGPGDCGGSGILAETGALWPAARNYSYVAIEGAGHCWEHHFVAQDGFALAHQWLKERGY